MKNKTGGPTVGIRNISTTTVGGPAADTASFSFEERANSLCLQSLKTSIPDVKTLRGEKKFV